MGVKFEVRDMEVAVDVLVDLVDAGVVEWCGSTGRMRPVQMTLTYSAAPQDGQWAVEVFLRGPSVRKNGKDGAVIALQRYVRDARELDVDGRPRDSVRYAPQWVQDFVSDNEPPESVRLHAQVRGL